MRGLVAQVFDLPAEKVPMTAVLIDDLGADSIDAAEITLAVEDSTGGSVADDEVARIETVRDIARFFVPGARPRVLSVDD